MFKVLEQTPKFDGALLSCALSKFVELQYQELVFDPSKVLFVDLHWLRSNFGKLSVDELAFSVWRAATALRNSNALEVEGVKHGSNWLVKLDDEPFDVKFVLEDQAQNYIVLNALPVLEPTVVIEDSGWLHNNVEPQSALLPDTVLEPARVSSMGEVMKMKNEFEFSQEDPGPTEILAAFKKGYLDGAKSTALVPSEGVHETAKALMLESNPVHNYYESESDVPTNHTELSQPPLEIRTKELLWN